MKRTLSILLTIAMIISLIPAVFAADVPTMSTTVDKTEVQPGDTITLTLSIDKTITNLNNWEWAIYFDKDAYVKTSGELEPGCTTSIGSTAGMVGDNVDILGKNAVRVSALSPSGDPVTLNAGKIATVTFTATENITAENARIEVKTEALPDYDTLKDNDVKLTGNIIDVTVKSSEAKGYTVSMGADKQVASGQIVEIPVTIGNNDGKTTYSAYDMTFSFDPTILKLNMEATSIEGYRVIPGDGTVQIVRYGKAAELGDALTLSFEAAGQGKSDVKVTEACVDTNANAIDSDAPAAAILDDTAVITVSGYTVSLPDDFTRTDAEGSVIKAGGNLTFVPKDPNYDYTYENNTQQFVEVEQPEEINEHKQDRFTFSLNAHYLLLLPLLLILLLAGCIFHRRRVFRKKMAAIDAANDREAIAMRYGYAVCLLRHSTVQFPGDAAEAAELNQKALFSTQEMTPEQRKQVDSFAVRVLDACKGSWTTWEKIRYRLWNCLY